MALAYADRWFSPMRELNISLTHIITRQGKVKGSCNAAFYGSNDIVGGIFYSVIAHLQFATLVQK